MPEFLKNFTEIIQEGLKTVNEKSKDEPKLSLDIPADVDREFTIPVKKGETKVGDIIGKEDKESNN